MPRRQPAPAVPSTTPRSAATPQRRCPRRPAPPRWAASAAAHPRSTAQNWPSGHPAVAPRTWSNEGLHHNGRMLGVIGGSGFYTFFESPYGSKARTIDVDTPYGEPSAPVTIGTIGEHEVAFLPRHGATHQFSAHTVPYRANMWALRKLGVQRVFGPCAVGSLNPENGP